jgi:hypothetical protein
MIRQRISIIVLQIIVPFVMLAMFIFGILIGSRATEPISGWSGFWLGLIVFVIYVLYRLPILQNFQNIKLMNPLPAFNRQIWLILAFGCIAGFVLLLLISVLKSNRGIGIITFLLTATSTCSLFSYIFIQSIRDTVMFFALGLLCGILIGFIFFPQVVTTIFS